MRLEVSAMGSWWDSLEKVSKANDWVLGFTALFGFLAAVLVIVGWRFGIRVSDLQKKELDEYQSHAGLQIANANQTAALANERAAQLENENLEIRRKLADRFLTDSEWKNIIDGLSPFAGHSITVVTVPGGSGPNPVEKRISHFR
jgi:hypothetical protein